MQRLSLFIAISGVSLALGCVTANPADQRVAASIALPDVPAQFSTIVKDVVVSPNVAILDDQTTEVLSDVKDDGTIIFNAPTDQIGSFRVGSVIIRDKTANVPHVLVRKVREVRREGGRTEFRTEPADLTDVIVKGSILVSANGKAEVSVREEGKYRIQSSHDKFIIDVNGEQKVLNKINLPSIGSRVSTKVGSEFQLKTKPIDAKLGVIGDVFAELSIEPDLGSWLQIDVDWGLKRFVFGIEPGVTTSYVVGGSGSFYAEAEFPLKQHLIAHVDVPIPVGPVVVPLPLNFEFHPAIGAEGSLTGEVKAEFKTHRSFRRVGSFEKNRNPEWIFDAPEPREEILKNEFSPAEKVKFFAYAVLKFVLSVGPPPPLPRLTVAFVQAKAGGELTLEEDGDPWLGLNAVLQPSAGFEVTLPLGRVEFFGFSGEILWKVAKWTPVSLDYSMSLLKHRYDTPRASVDRLDFLALGETREIVVTQDRGIDPQIVDPRSFLFEPCLDLNNVMVAKVEPDVSKGRFRVTAVSPGKCGVLFTGKGRKKTNLPVSVTSTTIEVL